MIKNNLPDIPTDLLYKLTKIKEKLLALKLRKSKKVYLTIKETRELLIKGESLPTNIFNAQKRDYIVKPRTIYGPTLTKKRKKN